MNISTIEFAEKSKFYYYSLMLVEKPGLPKLVDADSQFCFKKKKNLNFTHLRCYYIYWFGNSQKVIALGYD